jgi:hypothetical protein
MTEKVHLFKTLKDNENRSANNRKKNLKSGKMATRKLNSKAIGE